MMQWGELLEFILKKSNESGGDFLDESVTFYDATVGEYYPADTIEFSEHDDVLDAGCVFLTFQG